MKLPIFHSYYTVNLLIYLLIFNFVLVLCTPFAVLSFLLFRVPIYEQGIFTILIFLLNVYIIPIFILIALFETILRITGLLKNKAQTNLNFIKPFILWIIIIIGFIVFGFMNTICRHSQIPYTQQELEELRFD